MMNRNFSFRKQGITVLELNCEKLKSKMSKNQNRNKIEKERNLNTSVNYELENKFKVSDRQTQ